MRQAKSLSLIRLTAMHNTMHNNHTNIPCHTIENSPIANAKLKKITELSCQRFRNDVVKMHAQPLKFFYDAAAKLKINLRKMLLGSFGKHDRPYHTYARNSRRLTSLEGMRFFSFLAARSCLFIDGVSSFPKSGSRNTSRTTSAMTARTRGEVLIFSSNIDLVMCS